MKKICCLLSLLFCFQYTEAARYNPKEFDPRTGVLDVSNDKKALGRFLKEFRVLEKDGKTFFFRFKSRLERVFFEIK